MACLDDTLTARFHRWHGRSGRCYITTVFALEGSSLPDLGEAVLVAVSRRGGSRVILGLAAIERLSDWLRAEWRFLGADSRPDEWHVHLLAKDRAARAAVVADLGWQQQLAIVA